MGVTPPPVTSQRETVHLPLHPLCTPPPFLPTYMLRLQRCLCHSTTMPAVAPLRYLALCFFSLKEIDRNQKHDDVTAMDAYGSFYAQ